MAVKFIHTACLLSLDIYLLLMFFSGQFKETEATATTKTRIGLLFFCGFYSVPVLLFLGHLTSYHIWLKIENKSTYEHILEIRKKKREQEELAKPLKPKQNYAEINKKFNDQYSEQSSLIES